MTEDRHREPRAGRAGRSAPRWTERGVRRGKGGAQRAPGGEREEHGHQRLATVDGAVRRTVLPGGLRVITESLPAVRSASFGIWAGVGSRDEDQRHAGATHYL